jgi:hypothetical protein
MNITSADLALSIRTLGTNVTGEPEIIFCGVYGDNGVGIYCTVL